MDRHPHIIFHADGLILDDEDNPTALFEAKTSGAFAQTNFGPSGTSEVPPSYNLQVQQGMAVFDLLRAFMAVLIGGQDWRVYEILRDDELIADMIKVADNFWPCVVNKEPPDIDGSKDSARYLEAMYPQDSGAEIRADSFAIEWAGRLRQAREAKAQAEADELLARNKIVDHMRDATYLIGPGFKISHKKTKDRRTIKWMNVARELNASENLIESHSKVTPGGRRFTPVWKDA
jgi:predicted phage-related endonuclease